MKWPLFGFLVLTACANVFAQTATPIAPPQVPGTSTTGAITMSGCIGGGIGSGPITMMSPTIAPSSLQPGSLASSATPSSSQPSVVAPPAYQAPSGAPAGAPTTPGSGAVGTTGTQASGVVGTTGTNGPSGYRLTGSDLNSWIGRRVQIVGTMAPLTAETSVPTTGPASLQEFRVQSVVPLTGLCPQP
jgi:hypothetical protein